MYLGLRFLLDNHYCDHVLSTHGNYARGFSALYALKKVCSCVQVMFLGEIEEILDVIEPSQFIRVQEPLFKQIAACISSPHFQVTKYWIHGYNTDCLTTLKLDNKNAISGI